MTTLEAGGITGEYLMLTYANDAKLYVPVSSLHLISRYAGGAEENAPCTSWAAMPSDPGATKAAEKVRDVAAELLDIYAQRAAKAGFAFKHDREQYQLFCDGFPFETTPDQAQAINAVLSDMCQPLAMDRLGMRRCGLRQDRSGHARRLPRRGEPQAGGGAGADHPAGSAAL